MTIAVIADSSSQLTAEQADEAGIAIVPLTITIDGVESLDGVDLVADDFYERVVPGETEVSTAQPSPGAFVDAFERAASQGATHVLAVLVGSAYSGTIDSARIASDSVDVAVTIVDSGTSSFGVGAAALAAAQVAASGGSVDDAVAAAEHRASVLESVFILQGLELARRSGRFGDLDVAPEGDDEPIPVLWTGRGELEVIDSIPAGPTGIDDAVAAMARRVLERDGDLVVASGLAHPDTAPVSEALEGALLDSGRVRRLLRYRVGPSVAAHVGPGTAGVFSWPAD